MPGLFVKSKSDNTIKIGISRLDIKGRGERIIKNCLAGSNSPNIVNLRLSNIAVIEDFYINIISEALLLRIGI
jgi:hypothetical protein